MTETPTYWHGGGRIEGDFVLPPAETGAKNLLDYAADAGAQLDAKHVRRDRVFLTTDYKTATMFAAATAQPWVYEVEPVGTVEADPDYVGGENESFQAERARIVRRFKPSNQEVTTLRLFLKGFMEGATQ